MMASGRAFSIHVPAADGEDLRQDLQDLQDWDERYGKAPRISTPLYVKRSLPA